MPTLVVHAPFYHGVRRVLLGTDLGGSAGVYATGREAVAERFGPAVETRAALVQAPPTLPPE